MHHQQACTSTMHANGNIKMEVEIYADVSVPLESSINFSNGYFTCWRAKSRLTKLMMTKYMLFIILTYRVRETSVKFWLEITLAIYVWLQFCQDLALNSYVLLFVVSVSGQFNSYADITNI